MGIAGLSSLKHADTIDRGFIHIQQPVRFPKPDSTRLQKTTASDPILKPGYLAQVIRLPE